MTARGTPRPAVALGIHQAVVRRSAAMLARIRVKDELLFAGGVALNRCMQKLLEEALGKTVRVPKDPQIVGALGCALST
jgi:activator of 2-hydroxyglutaryl-CoA dehydratase